MRVGHVVLLALLMVAGSTAGFSARQHSEKKPAPQVKVKKAAPSKWTGGVAGKSPMDDTPTVVFRLRAENIVTGWLAKERPTLIARCQEKQTDVYVVLGMQVAVERGDSRTVRVRWDNEPAQEESWNVSTDGEALFSRDAVKMARKLAESGQLRFQFLPFNGSPQVATFDVRGFAGHMGLLARTCQLPEEIFYLKEAENIYHRDGCPKLEGLSSMVTLDKLPPNAVPCPVCRPPTRKD